MPSKIICAPHQPFNSNHQNNKWSKQSRAQQHPDNLNPAGLIQMVSNTALTPIGGLICAPTPAREEYKAKEEEEASNNIVLSAGLKESATAKERLAAGLTGPEDEEEDGNNRRCIE
ncbi:hypothetical protein MJO28_017028 [Puccinia striiformis f. sp. tritici]|uniref:Uncharacterized protein n=2 Tax=Puccinia striiformis TaxID=27350 RepID=A0A0L0V147_9BASI|nr:hypothetical protein MJO29_016639 [Puccinia striiformis f. sp. tritici]KAI7934458.1 hypothetical protein MJO28_017028 [Puccinia striiformis f. sp. tritici]KAI9621267.1 hypothetical protein KEM48_007781 [Puccinia striiformis f. sp. tritici PST-130]KNE92980.1 hypothetical protein PSTG_13617 [Puccinia striiformis f. sp. tritici PST-78]POW17799.1 hypothetical protein PSHT_06275 [Puccinia striiformis]